MTGWRTYAMRAHRQMIAEMEPEEAIRYLLEQLEGEHDARMLRVARVADTMHGIMRTPAALILTLSDAPGRTLSNDFIAARLEALTGSYHNPRSIQSALKHARAAIRTAALPCEIVTVTGMGLRMTLRDGWVPPWTVPPPSAVANQDQWVRVR